jgi:hypothetical protein
MLTRETTTGGIILRVAGQFVQPDFLPQARPAFKLAKGGITVFLDAGMDSMHAGYVTYKSETDATYYDWAFTFGWYVPGAFLEAAPYPEKFNIHPSEEPTG